MKNTEELKKYRTMTVDQLNKELNEVQKKMMTESLKIQAGKSGKSSEVNKLKKNIARIMTIISEK